MTDTDLVPHLPVSGLPTIDVERSLADLDNLKQAIRKVLVMGEFERGADYGIPPGITAKKDDGGNIIGPYMLFSSGCDKLGEMYGLATDPEIIEREKDFTLDPPFFGVTVKVRLISKLTGNFVAAGLGYCSTWEKKYRWKTSGKGCPECGQLTLRRSKYPPRDNPQGKKGWYCSDRACGGQFEFDHREIQEQRGGQITNDDTPSLINTVIKMATIRAKRAAILAATRCAGLFNDVYDPDDDAPEVEASNGHETRDGDPQEVRAIEGEPGRPERTFKITLQNREQLTAGITAPTIVHCFQLNAEIQKVTNDREAGKQLIGKALGRHHFIDLTEEQGKTAELLLEAFLHRQRDAAAAAQ